MLKIHLSFRHKKMDIAQRAAYKLIEIDKKYKIIKSGITAVDLGAAPGGMVSSFIKKNRLNWQGRWYRFIRRCPH